MKYRIYIKGIGEMPLFGDFPLATPAQRAHIVEDRHQKQREDRKGDIELVAEAHASQRRVQPRNLHGDDDQQTTDGNDRLCGVDQKRGGTSQPLQKTPPLAPLTGAFQSSHYVESLIDLQCVNIDNVFLYHNWNRQGVSYEERPADVCAVRS